MYARAGRFDGQTEPCKPGPKTELTDAELLAKVKEIIRENPFSGEGHQILVTTFEESLARRLASMTSVHLRYVRASDG